MGDRCYLQMTVRHEDLHHYVGFRVDGNVLTLEEADDGLFNERFALAEAGLTFIGKHEAGYSYPAQLFVAHRGRMHEVDCVGDRPAIAVDEDGSIRQEQLDHIRNFLALREDALNHIRRT